MKNQTTPTRWQLAWIDTSGQSHCVTLDNEPVGRITARPVVEPTPNLTERLNAIAERYMGNINVAMAMEATNSRRLATYHKERIERMVKEARGRLDDGEFYMLVRVWPLRKLEQFYATVRAQKGK
jgi:hypothetical protein